MSGHCNFCGVWHSGSCCHPGRPIPTQPFTAPTPSRPSDRAIAQAFWEFQEATTAVPVGHYDDTKGSSTYNWRRSFESAVLARAAELDATAAPVVVGEDVGLRGWLLMRNGDAIHFIADADYWLTEDKALAKFLRGALRSVKEAQAQGYSVAKGRAALAGD